MLLLRTTAIVAVLTVAFAALAAACGSTNSPNVQTPTRVIGAIEATADAGHASTTPATVPTGTGLTLSGTWTAHDDTSSSGGSSFIKNSDDLQATFTAHSTAASATALVGTAHVTFVKNYEQGGTICTVKFTGNAAWDAELTGEYHVQADGSILVSLTASPASGPTYTDQTNCFTQQVPVFWYGSGGTLVHGTFDSRKETPAQGGTSVTTTHMEVVR